MTFTDLDWLIVIIVVTEYAFAEAFRIPVLALVSGLFSVIFALTFADEFIPLMTMTGFAIIAFSRGIQMFLASNSEVE